MMPARQAVVRGLVQGVGFRAYVCRLAQSAGIRGEVWNRIDGAVETVYAHEDEAVLDRFEERLREGPGRVDSVAVYPLEDGVATDEFRIGPTRP